MQPTGSTRTRRAGPDVVQPGTTRGSSVNRLTGLLIGQRRTPTKISHRLFGRTYRSRLRERLTRRLPSYSGRGIAGGKFAVYVLALSIVSGGQQTDVTGTAASARPAKQGQRPPRVEPAPRASWW
ncbi:hypothetical protein GCM10010215_74830 [Streptomyces virginiae]|uniref:Uncharacterized protein n=1 Tax=Streptomyces virginiae TaxID=1961 RepID=A0ABQ3NNU8_STRVG|nr:hypothetical protein GCM10010215_74830 [Streptomyces virginiae]GHI14457.1 hypothetical protein Scinn_39200 [Streptomyces virginiae]GLV96329.1 hypothetical protein Slala04_77820 [Streptomyces lavendulae subsp. lavendulae]